VIKFFCLSLLVFVVVPLSCSVQDTPATGDANTEVLRDTTIQIVVGGDMMSHKPQVTAAWNVSNQRYEYEHWFQFVKPTIETADLAIANLETTLSGEPYTGYPCFSAPDAFAFDLKRVGFDVLVTANNHVADKGKRGIERTIRVLDSFDIKHTGSYRTQQERDSLHPLIIDVKGVKVAILSYTYSTNGLPVSKPNVVDLIDDSIMAKDIARARAKGAELVIPIMHWGNEYQTVEHPIQSRTASFLASKGVDAIVGMHPHVLQPIRYIKTKTDSVPVVYSLGNFVANMRDRYQNGGAMIKITAKRTNGRTMVTAFEDIPFYVYKGSISANTTSKSVSLCHGFYCIPESAAHLLPGRAEATQFFDDARRILRGSSKRYSSARDL